jgi:CheY-like chemotaxis protein
MKTHTQLNCSSLGRELPRFFGISSKWLVVDDDSLMRSVLAAVVEDQIGADVVECESGATALNAWEDLSGIEGIITDRDMPGIDGLELAARIHAEAPELPIILVTARAEDLDRKYLCKCGIRIVLNKPFSFKELASAIQRSVSETSWLAAA